MTDNLTFAQTTLSKGNFTLVLYNGKETISSYERGVKPLISLYDRKEDYSDFSAADKVIGKAAAFMYVLLGVRDIWAGVVSFGAVDVFREHGIKVTCDVLVPYIINRNKDGMCPMENAVFDISSPEKAYRAICLKLEELNK